MNFEDLKDTALEGICRLRDLIHGAGLRLTLKEAGVDTEKGHAGAPNKFTESL